MLFVIYIVCVCQSSLGQAHKGTSYHVASVWLCGILVSFRCTAAIPALVYEMV